MIGVHSSDGTKVFISGIDLEYFPPALEMCKVIVTFNRARFDLPFIEHPLPGANFDQLHIDWLYPLRRPGLTRGPKRIETELGLSRSGENTGFTNFFEIIKIKCQISLFLNFAFAFDIFCDNCKVFHTSGILPVNTLCFSIKFIKYVN
ncbi:MAG: hypothetical protein C5S40_00075 [ANME-2 cluster archaeon]|nr:hypothetical protein [ANME-2 cluster archaeon]